MTTVRKTISITDQQDEWIKAQTAKGGYTNDSEVIRELIRKAQDRSSQDGVNDDKKAEILEFMEIHHDTMQKLAH